MTLIGNVSVLTKDPGRSLGGTKISGERSNWNKPSPARAMYAGYATVDPKNAKPNGYRPGYGATVIQITGGGMASYVTTSGSGDFSNVNLAGSKEVVADGGALAGTGAVSTASADALANLVTALTGSGLLVGDVAGVLEAVSALTGSGTLSGDIASLVAISASIDGLGEMAGDIAGGLDASAGLSGSGSLSDANLVPLALLAASLAGSGTASADPTAIKEAVATLTGGGTLTADTQALAELIVKLAGVGAAAGSTSAIGYISAALLPYSELSPQSLANAVWQAEQAAYEDSGTFGANLDAPVSSIGGGSITEQGIAEAVWDKDTADHVAEGTFGNLMQRLLTVARYLGLR